MFDFTHSVVSVSILYKINFSNNIFPITFCDLYLVYTIRNSQTPLSPRTFNNLSRVAPLQVINGEFFVIWITFRLKFSRGLRPRTPDNYVSLRSLTRYQRGTEIYIFSTTFVTCTTLIYPKIFSGAPPPNPR